MNVLLLTHFLFFILNLFIQDSPHVQKGAKLPYPTPPVNENSLFYIQRSKNTNAIVYEINRKADGNPDEKNPVKIFWIRYAMDSTTEDLTYIQDRYAYGVTSRSYNGKNNSFVIQLVAYKKRNIFLLPTGAKTYGAFMNINGKLSELRKVFISISGGSFWFPKVDYIELTGKDPASRETVVERFVP